MNYRLALNQQGSKGGDQKLIRGRGVLGQVEASKNQQKAIARKQSELLKHLLS